MLSKEFPVYQLNEHKTSQICHKTQEKAKNLYLKINGISTKIYPVLTYKMGCRNGCINRDKNAINNFKLIVSNLLKTKMRPEIFTQKNKILSIATKKIKPSNLKRRSSNDLTGKKIVSLRKSVYVNKWNRKIVMIFLINLLIRVSFKSAFAAKLNNPYIKKLLHFPIFTGLIR